jgi:hypothetical protein
MEGRLLLDVVVGEGAAVFELLAGEDQALLVRGNALLVLNFRLYVVNRVAGLHLEGDSLAREGLDEAANVSILASPPSFLYSHLHDCLCAKSVYIQEYDALWKRTNLDKKVALLSPSTIVLGFSESSSVVQNYNSGLARYCKRA